MEAEANKSEQLSTADWLNWLMYSPQTTLIVFICCLGISLASFSIWSNDNFRKRCEIPLELAASASSIDIAKEQLTQTIEGCKGYEAQATKGFWQKNFKQSAKNLQISPNATLQEQYFALEQFREVMKNTKESLRSHRDKKLALHQYLYNIFAAS